MKAVFLTEHGGPEVLQYGDVPEPKTGPLDVKVRVKACSINRLDIFSREGVRGTRRNFEKPHVLGEDVAGDIVEVGNDVTILKPNDRVVINPIVTCNQCRFCVAGQTEFCVQINVIGTHSNGGYAEYISVPAANAIRLPQSVSYEQAASLPTVFMPSWSIMIRKGKLKAWETALVLSASSGVGTAAIQVAKNVIGARVIATTSSDEKAEKAKMLGADAVINYSKEDISERVKELTEGRGVELVLDHVGSDFWKAATSSMAPGGRYGICGVTSGYKAELQMGLMFLKHQTVFGVFMGRGEDLRQIVTLTGKGTIKGIIHKTFPLQEASKAHELLESRNFFGKIVLTI